MPTKTINGAELYCEMSGDGDPLVLVHGGWIDATSWDLVVPAFAEHYRVLTYDRRGHSRSRRPPAGSRRDDEDDLIALLETLDLAPAHLVPQLDDPASTELPSPTAVPTLLTDGENSPAWLPAITRELAATSHRRAARRTFAEAGHVPHLTHPAEHAQVAMTFAATASLVTMDL